jgi:hypothetical protein
MWQTWPLSRSFAAVIASAFFVGIRSAGPSRYGSRDRAWPSKSEVIMGLFSGFLARPYPSVEAAVPPIFSILRTER